MTVMPTDQKVAVIKLGLGCYMTIYELVYVHVLPVFLFCCIQDRIQFYCGKLSLP